ncbi:unnamed protein product [Leptosia nina]|uniref:Uncharacterized protein n=1 Tax=Leptosia nina TaxID=320188 RepID=A0AAV1IZG2_9NEOP
MSRNVVIVTLIVVKLATTAPSPLQVAIGCGSDEKSRSSEILNDNSNSDIDSFCDLINNVVPKGIKDGKFVLPESRSDEDLIGNSNAPIGAALAPPSGFIPKFSSKPKIRLKTPKINTPKLIPHANIRAPKLSAPMSFPSLRKVLHEDSSAERMERFKSGVQKMLHVVKVLGQIDQYLSERTRIVIDKLSRTFMD